MPWQLQLPVDQERWMDCGRWAVRRAHRAQVVPQLIDVGQVEVECDARPGVALQQVSSFRLRPLELADGSVLHELKHAAICLACGHLPS